MAYTGSKGFGCTANVYALFHLIYPSQMERIIIPDGPEKWEIRWQGTGKIRGTGCFPSHYPGCVKFRRGRCLTSRILLDLGRSIRKTQPEL